LNQPTNHSAVVKLKNEGEIPNKDFILKYDVAGRRIEDAILTHHSRTGGFFTMILQPPDRVTAEDVTPKELVFVLDTSGSMNGFPIEKAKEAMKHALDGLYPQDTFNLITFAGDTHILFPEPVSATPENLRKAQAFLASRQGSGGTEMMKAIRAALDPTDSQQHVRIVCFMTDGYIGNDMAIISEIQKHPNARIFSFGIGSSVNRFLLDKMAEEGRGEVEYVTLNDDGSAAAKRFHERVRSPLLTDISIDWAGLPVTDIYPKRIPDLFSAKPVVLAGRFTGSGRGVIRLKGKMAGEDFTREIRVDLPQDEPRRDVLAKLWARTRIDDLMAQDYSGIQYGTAREDVKESITQLGLDFRLMTQFTSFVAVEEMTVTEGGEPRRIEVPVDMPEGVSHEGVFGKDKEEGMIGRLGLLQMTPGIVASKGSTQANLPPPSPPPQPVATPQSQPTMAESLGVADTSKPLTPEEQKKRQLYSKLHPSVAAVIERLRNKTQPAADESKFVRNGKAEVQVWLANKSDATMAELVKLGFEVALDPKTSKLVIGRIAVEKLTALAELKTVTYITPMM